MLVLYYLNICLKQLYGFVINIYEMEPPRVLDKIPKWQIRTMLLQLKLHKTSLPMVHILDDYSEVGADV